jgi:STE24 endopeptidase
VFVIDESRYSNHTNAFFTGLGPTKNIYLFDTLLRDHPEGEGLAVVGHEAGHWRGAHVLKGLVLGTAALFAGALLLSWLYPRLAAGAGWRPLADPGSLPAVLLLALLGSFFASPLECLVSRAFEREADRAALELTGDRASCVETERRLARTNRSNLLPHPLVVWWYYSHPPPLERIEMAGGG